MEDDVPIWQRDVVTGDFLVQLGLGIAFYALGIGASGEFVRWTCEALNLPDASRNGLAGAGRWIGYFERFIVMTLVLVGEYQAIAFIFAGKSVARFRWQRQVEYYLVGTLASLSWAIGWGLVLRHLLDVLAA